MELRKMRLATSDELHRQIIAMAEARGHVMTWDDVQISIEKELTTIDMKWIDNVELIPRLYTRSWPYEGRIQVKRTGDDEDH
jgi:hypothetical protein